MKTIIKESNMLLQINGRQEIYLVSKNSSQIQNFLSTGIEWKPINVAKVSKDKVETTTEFLESLENDDDVQRVYTNSIFGNS